MVPLHLHYLKLFVIVMDLKRFSNIKLNCRIIRAVVTVYAKVSYLCAGILNDKSAISLVIDTVAYIRVVIEVKCLPSFYYNRKRIIMKSANELCRILDPEKTFSSSSPVIHSLFILDQTKV